MDLYLFAAVQWKETALMKAAEEGHTHTVNVFIKEGSSLDTQSEVS